jgi:hypothetical protein
MTITLQRSLGFPSRVILYPSTCSPRVSLLLARGQDGRYVLRLLIDQLTPREAGLCWESCHCLNQLINVRAEHRTSTRWSWLSLHSCESTPCALADGGRCVSDAMACEQKTCEVFCFPNRKVRECSEPPVLCQEHYSAGSYDGRSRVFKQAVSVSKSVPYRGLLDQHHVKSYIYVGVVSTHPSRTQLLSPMGVPCRQHFSPV